MNESKNKGKSPLIEWVKIVLDNNKETVAIVENRQEEITKGWKDFFGKRSERTCMTALIETRCGSGTYVRSIVHELGKFLSIGATTLHIVRTKVGNYSINDSIRS